MTDSYEEETRFYEAIAMIALPVVVIAVTSMMLGGRVATSDGPVAGISPVILAELVCLVPVFIYGLWLAFKIATRESDEKE